ncbi:hypothetical protein FOL47_009048 [Perkinsus chesapeaki]|uniref:Polycystin cation channel PKD1/PKD2 domain-containing protein n=1 Tax=Perkinsus chesapeaki TaxID=330153 RepID=A0A7J6LAK2_PERCH|nr:hypothetical protein FOL47_009048 [Perkinsus chesapeaki]
MSEDLQKVKVCLGLICGALRRTAQAADVADKLEKHLNQIDTQTSSINGDFLNTLTRKIDIIEDAIDNTDATKLVASEVHCDEHEEMQKVKLCLGLICGTLRRLASAQGTLGKLEKHIGQIDKQTNGVNGDVLSVLNNRALAEERKLLVKLKLRDAGEHETEPGSFRRGDLEDLQKVKLCLGLICGTLRRIASSAGILPKLENFIGQIDSQTSSINGDYLNNISARLDRIDEIIESTSLPATGEGERVFTKARKSFVRKATLSAEGADDLQKVKLCLGLLCAVTRRSVGASGIAEKVEKHLMQIDQQTSGINGDILNTLLSRIQAFEHKVEIQETELRNKDEIDGSSAGTSQDGKIGQIQSSIVDIENKLETLSSRVTNFHKVTRRSLTQQSMQAPEEMMDQKSIQRHLVILEAKLESAVEDRARIDRLEMKLHQMESNQGELKKLIESIKGKNESRHLAPEEWRDAGDVVQEATRTEAGGLADDGYCRQAIAACLENMDEFAGAIDGLSEDLNDLRNRTDAMQALFASNQRADETMNRELKDLHRSIIETRAMVERPAVQINDQTAAASQSQVDWSQDVDRSIGQLKLDLLSLQGDVSHIATRLEGADVHGTQQQQHQLKAGLQVTERNVIDLRDEVSRISDDINACHREVCESKRATSRLTVKLEQNQRDNAELEKSLKEDLEIRISTIDTRLAGFQRSLTEYREAMAKSGHDEASRQRFLPPLFRSQDSQDNPHGREDGGSPTKKQIQDLRLTISALTRAVVRFAQIVGVFPAPRFEELLQEAELGLVQIEPNDLSKWEDLAETLTLRIEKAWKQRTCGRFRNVLDLLARKADSSVLKLLQISQQQIENQLGRIRESQVHGLHSTVSPPASSMPTDYPQRADPPSQSPLSRRIQVIEPLFEPTGMDSLLDEFEPSTSWLPIVSALGAVNELAGIHDLNGSNTIFEYATFMLTVPVLTETPKPLHKSCSIEMERVYRSLLKDAGLPSRNRTSKGCSYENTIKPVGSTMVHKLTRAISDQDFQSRLAADQVDGLEALFAFYTETYGIDSSSISVLRLAWQRASLTDATIVGELHLAQGCSLSPAGHAAWISVNTLILAIAMIGILRDTFKIIRAVVLVRGHDAEFATEEDGALKGMHALTRCMRAASFCIERSKEPSEERYLGEYQSYGNSNGVDRFAGSLIINCLTLIFAVWRAIIWSSNSDPHFNLATRIAAFNDQSSASEVRAGVLELEWALRKEAYSANFGMLLMYIMIWRIIKCLGGHPMVAALSGTWYTARDEIFHFGITFTTIFVFMSLIGNLAGGEHFEHFRTVWSTLIIQFEILWSGEWDIPHWTTYPSLSLYLLLFVVVIFIALLNFFVAIVVEAYLTVRRTVLKAEYTQTFIRDYMAVMTSRFLFRWRGYPHRMELVKALAPLFAKKYVDMDDLENTGLFNSDTEDGMTQRLPADAYLYEICESTIHSNEYATIGGGEYWGNQYTVVFEPSNLSNRASSIDFLTWDFIGAVAAVPSKAPVVKRLAKSELAANGSPANPKPDTVKVYSLAQRAKTVRWRKYKVLVKKDLPAQAVPHSGLIQ